MISRTLLCTTGTSVSNGCPSARSFQSRESGWEEDTTSFRREIASRLAGFDLATAKGRVAASAELNALHRFGAGPDDEVILLATDTADGRACAEVLEDVLRREFGVREVRVCRVAGLQVHDAERLRRQGIANLLRQTIQFLDDPQRRYGGGCVLFPNGGFKGVVPFLTLLGMMFRAPVFYVFEFAETLVTLPPLPLGFATDMFERALPALQWAREQAVFPAEEFHRRISGYDPGEAEWFSGFLEVAEEATGGSPIACLSPLAEVLVQREGTGEAVIRVSPLARDHLDRLRGNQLDEVRTHLRKLASPLWRSQHRDSKYTNDLEFYPGGHNPWRFAGFTEGGVFHLCWFAIHREYEKLLSEPSRNRGAFPMEGFADFSLPVTGHVSESGEPEGGDPDAGKTWLDLRGERDALQARLGDAEGRVDDLTARNRALSDEIMRLRAAHLDAGPRSGDAAGETDQKRQAEVWLNREVSARCETIRPDGLLLRFRDLERDESWQVLVAKADAPLLGVGEDLQVVLHRFDGLMFLAKPVGSWLDPG